MLQAEQDLLVIAAQSGNYKAFDVLVKHYQKPLLHFAFKLCGDYDLASDAVQDSWIKTTKNLHQLKDPCTFRSWIYRLVKWRTIDLNKARNLRKEQAISQDNEHILSASGDFQEQSALGKVIQQLPEIERHMIHLFYLDELKAVEIAVVLDIPLGTVKSRLSRARKLLRNKIEK